VSEAASSSFTIEPAGPFSLAASARFIAGWPPAEDLTATEDGAVRLCFALDSLRATPGSPSDRTPKG